MSEKPAYCCQECGECIGYVGRSLQWALGSFAPHTCRKPSLLDEALLLNERSVALNDKALDLARRAYRAGYSDGQAAILARAGDAEKER